MEKQPLINFIKNNVPNIMVTPANVEMIAENFEKVNYSKNDYFLKEGKISGYLYLQDGFMRAFSFDTEGNEVTTFFYGSQRAVFDVSSFFLHSPSEENIQAVTECVGFVTTFEKLNGLFHSIPEFREFGRQMLVQEFIAYKQRTLSMINKTAEDRYQNLINNHKEIFKYAQLRHIASFLGITDSSLSRIRRQSFKP
jgi:CRP-like cAMP-binding protein